MDKKGQNTSIQCPATHITLPYLDLIDNGIVRSKDMNIIKANERNKTKIASSQVKKTNS
jgi:hypothetical protein